MNTLLFLIDLRPDPVGGGGVVPWGALILLLVIVFILAVGFTGGLVALLIWLKRRKVVQPEIANQPSSTE